jgi:hypothetical protein
LSNDGVSLAGVNRILALEEQLQSARQRIADLEARLESLLDEMESRVQAVHKEYRREIVPLRSAAVVRFEPRR